MPDRNRLAAVIRQIDADLDEAVRLDAMARSLRLRADAKAKAWDLTIRDNEVLTNEPESEKMP